jgi:heptosyltransferase-2
MPAGHQHRGAQRLLIVMPTWLGDIVMATPTLRALRAAHPEAHIAAAVRGDMAAILDGGPWVNQVIEVAPARRARWPGAIRRAARQLADGGFDAAVLLPNSFRCAFTVWLAGVPRRVGYQRDGRGGLLTDRLLPRRNRRRYVPVPAVDYYLALAAYLGGCTDDVRMELFTRAQDDARADALLRQADAGAAIDGARPLVLITPGASFGQAKLWDAARFAAVADRCVRELGAMTAVSGAPAERAILDAVIAAAQEPMIDLPKLGLDLRLLKSVIKRSRLLITNDTGTRHVAAALGVPVVTIFGPTDPAWTDIRYARERHVMTKLPCQPCQEKLCPLAGTPDEHQCMKRVTVDMVFAKVRELIG